MNSSLYPQDDTNFTSFDTDEWKDFLKRKNTVGVTLEDWKQIYNKYPQWHKRNTGQVRSDRKGGGMRFYTGFLAWCKNQEKTGVVGSYKELLEQLFPPIRESYTDLTTIEDWKQKFFEYNWYNKNTRAIRKDGGYGFYQEFLAWCKNQEKTGVVGSYKELLEQLFPPIRESYTDLTTIDDWKRRFNENMLYWNGKSRAEMQKDKNTKGASFINRFLVWCQSQETTGRVQDYEELYAQIFLAKYSNYDNFRSIEEWKYYFQKNPEWHGKNTLTITHTKNGLAFYSKFRSWCQKQEQLGKVDNYKELFEQIFPPRGKVSFVFDNGELVNFDSHPERIVGIILWKLGMISHYIDRKNLHIPTNGSKRHSIDFRIGDIFLEYHPISIADKKAGRTFTQSAERKKTHITSQEYTGRMKLYVFDNIDILYEIIASDRELQSYIRHPKYGIMFSHIKYSQSNSHGYEQGNSDIKERLPIEWKELVTRAYALATDYDKSSPKKKKYKT